MSDLRAPASAPPDVEASEHPVAGMDRRFYGFFLDRLVAWVVYAAAAFAAYHYLIDPGRLWAGVGAIAGAVLLVGLLTSVAVGLAGVTPANAMVGVRVVSSEHAGTIGLPRAILRTFVLGAATLPTFGFGAAALAWTAVVDPTGRRRGWHDQLARSVVVDVRPAPVEEEPEEEPPSLLVNLTAMRLVPASPHPPRDAPARRRSRTSRPAAPPADAAAQPATPEPPRPSLLGWPLVGSPPEQSGAPATLGTPPPAPPVQPGQPGPAAQQPSTVAGSAPGPKPTAPPPGAPPSPVPSPVPSPSPSHAVAPSASEESPPEATTEPPPIEPTRPAAHARAQWRVSFDTGESFEVRGLTLVGRRPEARSGEPVKQLVTLPSDDMSLSKTHAQFQVVPDGALVVMDRGSTNGSILLRGGVSKRLVGGKPATLREGDRVRFGDREMTVSKQ